DRMGRAVDVLDGMLRLDGRLDGELLERAGRLAVGLERVDVLDQAGVARGHGREAERDLLIAPGQDGEDLHAQEVVAHVFEQAMGPGQARPGQQQRQHRQIATHGLPLSWRDTDCPKKRCLELSSPKKCWTRKRLKVPDTFFWARILPTYIDEACAPRFPLEGD